MERFAVTDPKTPAITTHTRKKTWISKLGDARDEPPDETRREETVVQALVGGQRRRDRGDIRRHLEDPHAERLLQRNISSTRNRI
jgi:hypothetical protein